MDHMRSRSALSCIFLSCHSSFDKSRVVEKRCNVLLIFTELANSVVMKILYFIVYIFVNLFYFD